jgi:hypothetical protein
VRIEVDPSSLSDREAALVRLLCDVAFVETLGLDVAERRGRLSAIADALERVLPGVRARVTD